MNFLFGKKLKIFSKYGLNTLHKVENCNLISSYF